MDATGTTNIVWENGEIRAASRSASGAWTEPIGLSSGRPGYPGSEGFVVLLVRFSRKARF